MVLSSTSAPRRGQPARMRLSSSAAGPAATAPAASKRAASRAPAAAGAVTWTTNGAPSVARAGRPAVYDDHPFGGEQRAVHERAVAGELDIVRQQPLEGRDGPGARERHYAGLDARHQRAGVQRGDERRRDLTRLDPRDLRQ